MNRIEERQNSQSALEKLAAQRCLYSEAKLFFYVRAIVALGIAVVFPFLGGSRPPLGNYLTAIAVAYLLLDIFILDNLESGKRRAGAKIQELFDTEVLEIPWNPIVAEEKPDGEEIGRCLLKVKKKGFVELRDWYPGGVSKLSPGMARTLCQRANLWWDSSLRRWYSRFLVTAAVILVGTVIWINKEKTVANALVFFASFAPLFKVLIEQSASHREAAKRLDSMKAQLDLLLESAANGGQIDDPVNRSIQDEIYRHRSTVAPIPDSFYRLLKKRYENLMSFNTQEYIRKVLPPS